MYPKELPIMIYDPGRRLAEFALETDLKSKTLDEVVDIFDAFKFNIITGLVVGNVVKERRMLEFFVDHTEATVSLEELSNTLRKVAGIFGVECREGVKEGLVTCQLCFPPLVAGERAVVFRMSVFESWFKRMYSLFKSGAVTILFEAGLESGTNAAKSFGEKLKLKREDLIRFIASLAAPLGWGSAKVAELNMSEFRAVVRVEDLFECLPFKGQEAGSRSQFVRGYITGAFRAIWGKEVSTVETRCLAKGDPYCEFQITGR